MKPTGPWNRQTTPFLYSHHNAANFPIVKASASSSVKQPEVKTSRRVAGIKKIKDQTTFLQNCPEKWISRTDSTCLQHGKKCKFLHPNVARHVHSLYYPLRATKTWTQPVMGGCYHSKLGSASESIGVTRHFQSEILSDWISWGITRGLTSAIIVPCPCPKQPWTKDVSHSSSKELARASPSPHLSPLPCHKVWCLWHNSAQGRHWAAFWWVCYVWEGIAWSSQEHAWIILDMEFHCRSV